VAIDGKILLRRKANLRSGKTRAIGTFFVTSAKLSFQPLAGKRSINIPISKITDMNIVGKVYKKMAHKNPEGWNLIFYHLFYAFDCTIRAERSLTAVETRAFEHFEKTGNNRHIKIRLFEQFS